MSLKAQVAKEIRGGRNVSVYIDRVFSLQNKNYLIVIAQSNLYIWGTNRRSLSDFRECLKQSKELSDVFGGKTVEVVAMLFQDMKVRP